MENFLYHIYLIENLHLLFFLHFLFDFLLHWLRMFMLLLSLSTGLDICVKSDITFNDSRSFLRSWSFSHSARSIVRSGSFVTMNSFIILLSSSVINPSFLNSEINVNTCNICVCLYLKLILCLFFIILYLDILIGIFIVFLLVF